jgi:hypothetical protein
MVLVYLVQLQQQDIHQSTLPATAGVLLQFLSIIDIGVDGQGVIYMFLEYLPSKIWQYLDQTR